MIKSFSDKETETLWKREWSKKIPQDIHRRALRKLTYLHNAHDLNDLRQPPGNRLEKLSGDRSEQYSIRINQQWRICFRWDRGDAYDVEITDYH